MKKIKVLGRTLLEAGGRSLPEFLSLVLFPRGRGSLLWSDQSLLGPWIPPCVSVVMDDRTYEGGSLFSQCHLIQSHAQCGTVFGLGTTSRQATFRLPCYAFLEGTLCQISGEARRGVFFLGSGMSSVWGRARASLSWCCESPARVPRAPPGTLGSCSALLGSGRHSGWVTHGCAL